MPRPGHDGHREHPLYREQRSVERQFAHDEIVGQARGLELPRCGEYAKSYGEVVGRSLFPDIGRSHVDDNFLSRIFEAAMVYGRAYALGALFDHGVGQSDHNELKSGLTQHLDGDRYGINALERCSGKFYKHKNAGIRWVKMIW